MIAGYLYEYPFLTLDDCEMEVVEGKYVTPLYRHFIHSKFTSLAFFGLTFLNPALPLADCQVRSNYVMFSSHKRLAFIELLLQARFYTKFLEGKVKLPSEVEMNEQIQYDFNLKANNGLGISKSHSFEDNPWNYFKTLGAEAGFTTSWIPFMKSIYNHVLERRNQFPTLYKFDKVIVKSQNEYEYVAIEETLDLDEFSAIAIR